MIEFLSEAQKNCFGKVSEWMRELYGEMALVRDDAPGVVIQMGSATAHAIVFPWGDDDATICVRSYVVQNLDITPDLMEYLLKQNASMRFGAFAIDSDNDIIFEHTIVGSTCDKMELKASVLAVVHTADTYDNEIVSRWGGEM